MKKHCEQFDKYRDGELDPAGMRGFEAHLEKCADCSSKSLFLNNIVQLARQQDLPAQSFTAEKIARAAFESSGSWDMWLAAWLRPAPAWSLVALMLVLTAILWTGPTGPRAVNLAEIYFSLTDSDSLTAGNGMPEFQSDEEIKYWLEQGGKSQ